MSLPVVHTWKKAPFIRMLIPLMAGIIIQWHVQAELIVILPVLMASFFSILALFFLPLLKRYRLAPVNGFLFVFLFAALGALLAWIKDIRHQPGWFGNYYKNENALVVTLTEAPVEKTKSYKANASVNYVLQNDSSFKTTGTIILYFKKDSSITTLGYGTQLLIKKPLQKIKNSGNPGGFDYKRYSLFQGITHQVYLREADSSGKEKDFIVLPGENKKWFRSFILSTREKILNIIRSYIRGEKELGLAEALLIGYKDDLDKTLVQSYTNTGVVHVIAISGLHLGLIYWLLLWLVRPVPKKLRWLRPVIMLAGLWLFSLLAGAQPSVIRSAVMFTCIVLCVSFDRKTSIFNTLALSAFILLCYNPYWLWDVGFQLSYAAVLSIVIFMQPIYNWFYIKNKALDFLWKLNAITLAAQILTLPVSIYHFHQFPNYFLLTNLIAVPLSSLVLLGEIFLCAVSFAPAVAAIFGKILSWLIWLMNSYVERIELLPFSLWDGLQISILQAVLLAAIAAGFGYWLMEKSKAGLKWGKAALLAFITLRTVSFIQAGNRQQVIVYNVPQKQAIDFIEGRKYFFTGDNDLLADDFTRNFHIKPSRIFHRIEPAEMSENFISANNLFLFNDKKIMLLDTAFNFIPSLPKTAVDLLVISKNPKLYFKKLTESFVIKEVVFDGSCPAWKTRYWKKDCDSLGIPYHDVSEKGAFVMKVN